MKKEVKLNNIPLNCVVFTKTGENIIFSPSIEEQFFGIYTVNILKESVLCEQYKENYVNCKLTINNHLFENVIFKLIKSDVSRVVINENLIDEPFALCENSYTDERDLVIENLRLEVERLRRDKQQIHKKLLVTESTKHYNLQETNKQKEELLKEFINFTNNQNNLIEERLETVENKLINAIEAKFLIRQDDIKNHAISEATNKIVELSRILQSTLLESAVVKASEVYEEKYENVKDKLSGVIFEELKTYKSSLYREFSLLSEEIKESKQKYVEILEESSGKKKLITETDKQLEKLTKRIDSYGSKINAILNEKRNLQQIVETNKQYTDVKFDQVLEESKRYGRLILDLAGGGSGSVATQLVGGNEIQGDLNIAGNVTATGMLSGTQDGNINIIDIFAGEGPGDNNNLDGGQV